MDGHERIVVIGAGVGGLAAALRLAVRGLPVTLCEAGDAPGGKMRPTPVGEQVFDAGPTVLTLRSVFDELFASAGTNLDDWVTVEPAPLLARHHWSTRETLDLHADRAQSAEAIGRFAGAREARGFEGLCDIAEAVYGALFETFMVAQRPGLVGFSRRAGPGGLLTLNRASPFRSMWGLLSRHFDDPRLRQLFGRYATYCGSSPFDAPATLALVVHAELAGVWTIAGGMHVLAGAMATLCEQRGVEIRYSSPVEAIDVSHGRASGVRLRTGERIAARAVISNADVSAHGSGRLGPGVRTAASPVPRRHRSLSAVTWCLPVEPTDFPLVRHNVFFGGDYKAEFDALFGRRELPADPTVYLCAEDRASIDGPPAGDGPERVFCLVNAPADGDGTRSDGAHALSEGAIDSCETAMHERLRRCGLSLRVDRARPILRTTPMDFETRYPGSGGALYGRATHGWKASFERAAARSRLDGLYLSGGSVHPSAGVPMAAISGRLAAEAVLADWSSSPAPRSFASTPMSPPVGTVGGTSTR